MGETGFIPRQESAPMKSTVCMKDFLHCEIFVWHRPANRDWVSSKLNRGRREQRGEAPTSAKYFSCAWEKDMTIAQEENNDMPNLPFQHSYIFKIKSCLQPLTGSSWTLMSWTYMLVIGKLVCQMEFPMLLPQRLFCIANKALTKCSLLPSCGVRERPAGD